jgi:hypothetical protein
MQGIATPSGLGGGLFDTSWLDALPTGDGDGDGIPVWEDMGGFSNFSGLGPGLHWQ